MAIDVMKKATLFCPISSAKQLLKALHSRSIIQLVDVLERFDEAHDTLVRPEVSTADCDEALQKLSLILGLINTFAPEQKSFIQGLAPVPLLVDPVEMDHLKHDFPLEQHYKRALEIDMEYRKTERAQGDIENRLEELKALAEFPYPVDALQRFVSVRLFLGALSPKNVAALNEDPEAPAGLAWEEIYPHALAKDHSDPKGKTNHSTDAVWLLAAVLPEEESEGRSFLNAHGFMEIALPQISGTVADQIRSYKEDLAVLSQGMDKVKEQVTQMAGCRHEFEVLRAYWEDRKKLKLSRLQCARGEYVQIITGFVREQDCDRLDESLHGHFPDVSIVFEDVTEEDEPPVSLTLPKLVRPVQLLVDLFGRPTYDTFDPSPFIMPTFLLFFGICFSDVAYGSMLALLSLYIMKKTKPYVGIYNFARLLLYGGLSTIFFGFVLGGFFGDLYMPEYLGENNLLYRIMTSVQVISPLEKPIVVLLLSLAIGMFNQFYGIAMQMYSALLRGDKKSALFDGLLWLVTLPGCVILISKMFVNIPSPVFYLGMLLFFGGAIGLVLTQGRENEGIVQRLLTGVVSLYGIVGSYGITAFVGDTMSYCRLLALALTTGIVALSFNMMAGLLRPIPYVGFILFVVVLIAAHVFNFFINVLGAFVHSMRLIFVEFFGRFYESGSKSFTPLGFDSKSAVLYKKQ
jgi:V/A-type H+-transporting ATPase subunit I